MKSKIINRQEKTPATFTNLKKEISELKKIVFSQGKKILELEKNDLKYKKILLKEQTKKLSKETQPFEITLRGLNDKHDIIYSSKK